MCGIAKWPFSLSIICGVKTFKLFGFWPKYMQIFPWPKVRVGILGIFFINTSPSLLVTRNIFKIQPMIMKIIFKIWSMTISNLIINSNHHGFS
jgi:hypothetical protein